MQNKNTIKYAKIIVGILIIWGIIKVISSTIDYHNVPDDNGDYTYQSDVLRVISSSENEVLEDEIMEYAKKNHIKMTLEYADTLDIMQKINSGEKYDAVWSSNSIWLYMIDSSIAVKNAKSLSINPVIFGIKKSKAKELGLVDKDITTNDLLDLIKSGDLKFSMANPITTNSGASAYLGITSTLAGNPEVLTSDILKDEDLKNNIKTFFTGLQRTSGSEDFLEKMFLKGDFEAVVTYESSIININKKLEKEGKEPLYALYPIDGVSISDSTLAYIDNKDDNKKEMFEKLQDYLLSSDGQKLLEKHGRRTWFGGVNKNADKKIFNKKWGIDTTKYITPVKYPSTKVITEALNLYQTELRKPVHVVFCLDYSGSMYGYGIDELIDAMTYVLTEETASKNFIQFTDKDIIDVIPFASNADTVWHGNEKDLLKEINDRTPGGSTALYVASEKALELLKDEDDEKYTLSVILMTDGEGNVGSYNSLKKTYKSVNKDIPIYGITFGYADERQLEKIAELTNGKVFDGKTDLVEAFKQVRGYN